ncbi:MAG: cytochrome c [Terracidiphilus sp.]
MLKPLLFFSAVVLLVISASVAPGPAAQEPAGAKNPAKITAQSQARAKELWERDCSFCHNHNGDGKTDMAKDFPAGDFTDVKTLAAKSDQDLFTSIRKGKGKMFPEDAGRAKDDEIWNLVAFVRSLAAPQPAAPPAADAPKTN